MSWRPWVLAALFLVMIVANGALMFFEETRPQQVASGPVDRVRDELLLIAYGPGTRTDNFEAFGLPPDLVEEARGLAMRVFSDHQDRLKILLQRNATDARAHLCADRAVPERYAALGLLVEEVDTGGTGAERRIVDWRRMTTLQQQDWYATSLVPDVYERVELSVRDRADSTVMGVGAILTLREDDVLEGRRPFGNGLGAWSFRTLRRNHPDLDEKLVEYFAVMHVLVELARDPDDGVCAVGG